jgi:hypothetical protein
VVDGDVISAEGMPGLGSNHITLSFCPSNQRTIVAPCSCYCLGGFTISHLTSRFFQNVGNKFPVLDYFFLGGCNFPGWTLSTKVIDIEVSLRSQAPRCSAGTGLLMPLSLETPQRLGRND